MTTLSRAREVITVDGPASSGKTSLSKALAERLRFVHFNSGLLYRAAALLVIKHNFEQASEAAIGELISRHQLTISHSSKGDLCVLTASEEVAGDLFSLQVSEVASRIAGLQKVRQALELAQRNAFPGCNLVAEGRDMGTIIFPHARLKFFINVDSEVAIERRVQQLRASGGIDSKKPIDELRAAVRAELRDRDLRDKERPIARTVAHSDAILIDNSFESFDKIVDKMTEYAIQRGIGVTHPGA